MKIRVEFKVRLTTRGDQPGCYLPYGELTKDIPQGDKVGFRWTERRAKVIEAENVEDAVKAVEAACRRLLKDAQVEAASGQGYVTIGSTSVHVHSHIDRESQG